MKEELKSEKPLITICIPVYNGGKFIGELLDSIKQQTYPYFKCHIVNNASTDDTEKITLARVGDDSRFEFHKYDEFVDICSNWNRTVNHIDSNAKYFKVVQADDILLPESLETMVELMELHPSAGIGTSFRIVGDHVYGFGVSFTDGSFHNGKDILLRHLKDKAEITGSITQLFFNIEHLKKIDSFPIIFHPDEYHFDTRLAYEMFLVSDMVFSFKPLSFTRRHEGAETAKTVNRYNTLLHGKESRLYRFKDFFPELEKEYRILRRNYAYFIFKSYLRNQRDAIAWHNKYLRRKIKPAEIISGIIWGNRFGAMLAKKRKIK